MHAIILQTLIKHGFQSIVKNVMQCSVRVMNKFNYILCLGGRGAANFRIGRSDRHTVFTCLHTTPEIMLPPINTTAETEHTNEHCPIQKKIS